MKKHLTKLFFEKMAKTNDQYFTFELFKKEIKADTDKEAFALLNDCRNRDDSMTGIYQMRGGIDLMKITY